MHSMWTLRASLALVAALLAGVASAAPPSYPFGSRLQPYAHGIRVSNPAPGVQDAAIRTKYDQWKAQRIARSIPTIPGGMAVKFSDQTPPPKLTVSEGIGYGMLLTVVMAGHDPEAQLIFDGLLRTARARPADGLANSTFGAQYGAHAPYLMEWELRPDGSHTGASGDRWPAMDGDLDIALALLMADRQWGSGGTWNYRQEALRTINAIKAWFTYPDGRLNLRFGGEHRVRTSDFMFGHFRAFRQAANDAHWDTVISRQLTLLETVVANHSPSAGLQPDFVHNTNTSPVPGLRDSYPMPCTQRMGDDSISDTWYFANAQRNPWRFGADYVFSGDARLRAVLMRMMTFFRNDTGGDPNRTAIGYTLSGGLNECLFRPSPNWAYGVIGPLLGGATVDATFQGYLNALWAWNDSNFSTAYYNAELQLLPMILASGNWWTPGTLAPPPSPPSPAKVQAESGTVQGSGVSIKNDVAGYEGAGFVGSFTAAGDRLTVTFPNVTAGTYDIRIRYHAWTAQMNYVAINGGTPLAQAFPATGSNWGIVTVGGVALAAGSSAVTISKDWGYINVDSLELVPAGSGGIPPTAQQRQAEAGTLSGSGVSVKTDVAGYQGTGFVGNFSSNGDTLTVSFPNVVAGTYRVRIRYHAWTPQENTVTINGASRTVSFPATHPNWSIATVTGVALPAGTSTVVIRKDWGWINVDWIEIVP
ncbi:MAG TPA: glycosyl hydrolase family 8 [Archangium sp.]|nr:glycosyl hydrolase family 8 [Archangium sp.]